MVDAVDRLIVAVDVPDAGEALRLAHRLRGRVGALKVGLELANAAGIDILDRLRDGGAPRVFYDCKLHDIPNTVAGATRAIAARGVWMMNVHASGGSRMVRAAAEALAQASLAGRPRPLLLGVTLLTSIAPEELADELRVGLDPIAYVRELALLSRDAGADGVVASPLEIGAVRDACGPGFLIVTPGVRPHGADRGDQRRVATPGEAIRAGATHIVVGRPVTAAPDPAAAAEAIVEEIASAA
ncbi:MAG TPA: orotidine-5'-phosphate decarboxylase [Chthonomonadales bacterium]|nr:orotidine-5'-phosphate decarboxylase [Chthonomonadales bacterium]